MTENKLQEIKEVVHKREMLRGFFRNETLITLVIGKINILA